MWKFLGDFLKVISSKEDIHKFYVLHFKSGNIFQKENMAKLVKTICFLRVFGTS